MFLEKYGERNAFRGNKTLWKVLIKRVLVELRRV